MRRDGWPVGALALLSAAAVCTEAATLTPADYQAHRRQIDADYRQERIACDRLTLHDKEVCMVRARGHRAVARAELDFNNTGTDADRQRLVLAKADAERDVAVERCGERQGADRRSCIKAAEDARGKSLEASRLQRSVGAAVPEGDAASRGRGVAATLHG